MSDDTQPEDTGTPAPAPEPAPVKRGLTRYAAYDKDAQRFTGGVHATRNDARRAAKDRGAESVEIREV